MRWIGFDFDQIGLEHMVARITGMRNAGQMNVQNTPRRARSPRTRSCGSRPGIRASTRCSVTWRDRRPDRPGDRHRQQPQPRPGAAEPARRAPSCTPRSATRSARTASTGSATRRPTTRATDSGFNGSRFVQTRTWTVGDTTVTPSPAGRRTSPFHDGEHPPGRRPTRSSTSRPTTRPTASCRSRGRSTATAVPNPTNSRNLDLGALDLPAGTHTLTAKVTDGALSDTVEWKIDKVAADRARGGCPTPLTTLTDTPRAPGLLRRLGHVAGPEGRHAPATTGTPAVVGQFRLDRRRLVQLLRLPGEADARVAVRVPPLRHQVVKALTYGNLGTGGLSTAGVRADAAGRPPERPLHPGLRHAPRRAPRDRPGRQLRQAGVLQGHGAAGRLRRRARTTAHRRRRPTSPSPRGVTCLHGRARSAAP